MLDVSVAVVAIAVASAVAVHGAAAIIRDDGDGGSCGGCLVVSC